MVGASRTLNVVFDGIVARQAASFGWSGDYNQNLIIRNSAFVDNGVTGLNGQRDKGTLLENSLIARNNLARCRRAALRLGIGVQVGRQS